MYVECYPISGVPGTTALFRDYAEAREGGELPSDTLGLMRRWYPSDPFSMAWARQSPTLPEGHRVRLAEELSVEVRSFGGGPAAIANVDRIRDGAAAVVTGQQVGLFGGPLLTLMKAATAVRKAKDATRLSGRAHVPVFWLATEDHDLAEVDQIALPAKDHIEMLRLGLQSERPLPVGALSLDNGNEEGRARLAEVLDRAAELLGWSPAADLLRKCYMPEDGRSRSLAAAFGCWLTEVFAEQGLIVMDAAGRSFHAIGAPVLRAAIERADELEAALLHRSQELTTAGYHAQVLVAEDYSLLFLLDGETGARQALRRVNGGSWKAGLRSYSASDLLQILAETPERLSPNALLRPVFQDAILPTAAYIGGPAEIAYFAQSAVVYERVLGRVTPVLPRLSATLVDPSVAKLMAQHELTLPSLWGAETTEELGLRLGARSMPIEGKRKIAAAGNAMDAELSALTAYLHAMSAELGRSAEVSGSKMRYQMNRLRRLAARFELQKSASLAKQAIAMMLSVYPDGHLAERVVGGVWALARFGDELPQLLVECAGQECPGHRAIFVD